MENLNRNMLDSVDQSKISVGNKKEMPVKIIQFGEGNFLRAFMDYMVDKLNEKDIFNGSIAIVQPIEQGMVNILEKQEGLYTCIARGLEDGKEVVEKRIVTSVSDYINPFENYDKYIGYAKDPNVRFVISNTTEAGICYEKCDINVKPQKTFPAKVTAFLYERFQVFGNDKEKGLAFLPCELIDNNGDFLKKYVLQHAKDWELGEDFINWVEDANYFCSTLVDRIVTGYPRDEITEILEDLGYNDNLVVTSEIFHNLVIEGPTFLAKELPFDKIGLHVLFTPDAKPYKLRKVRILNGAHTATVLAGYLSGIDIVRDLVGNKTYNDYIQYILNEEIIPILPLPKDEVVDFAKAVSDRFANPFIKHRLLDISLNSISKYKVRVLPSILEYKEKQGALPEKLVISFSALIKFYQGQEIVDNALIGNRGSNTYPIKDTLEYLEIFKGFTKEYDKSNIKDYVTKVCSQTQMWGQDLNEVDGFNELVTSYLELIEEKGMENAVEILMSK
ncbi:MAG: tagaturonate reductase [Lachnospirales bacterium]